MNGDCVEYMKNLPDNAYDLAIVDPPYGDADGICSFVDNRGRLPFSKNSRFEKYMKPTTENGGGKNGTGLALASNVTSIRKGGTWFAKYNRTNHAWGGAFCEIRDTKDDYP